MLIRDLYVSIELLNSISTSVLTSTVHSNVRAPTSAFPRTTTFIRLQLRMRRGRAGRLHCDSCYIMTNRRTATVTTSLFYNYSQRRIITLAENLKFGLFCNAPNY
jgi:hypothetical protein